MTGFGAAFHLAFRRSRMFYLIGLTDACCVRTTFRVSAQPL